MRLTTITMNKRKHTLAIVIGITVAILVAAGAFAYILLSNSQPDTEGTNAALQSETATSSVGLPARLLIPQLHIDANIQSVGHTKSGNMGAPSNFTDVAWFREGPRPGALGSAVIAGHLDNALALSGVFKKLGQLVVGDAIVVRTEGGAEIHFRVVGIQEYPYDKVPTDMLFNKKGGEYLNLITCAGSWLQKYKTYDHRLVVYTQKVS